MPRGYHDIGGTAAGEVPQLDLPWAPWEKQVEAVRDRSASPDEITCSALSGVRTWLSDCTFAWTSAAFSAAVAGVVSFSP